MNDSNLCRKRELINTDGSELAGYVRYDAIHKMITNLMENINTNRGRMAYTGKGGDETDR